jgi:hypothetical protein
MRGHFRGRERICSLTQNPAEYTEDSQFVNSSGLVHHYYNSVTVLGNYIGKAVEAWPYIQWICTVYNSRVCRPSFLDKYLVDVELYCISAGDSYDIFTSGSRLHLLDMVWMSYGCSLRMNEY